MAWLHLPKVTKIVTDYWQITDNYATIGTVILKNQPFLGGIYEI